MQEDGERNAEIVKYSKHVRERLILRGRHIAASNLYIIHSVVEELWNILDEETVCLTSEPNPPSLPNCVGN